MPAAVTFYCNCKSLCKCNGIESCCCEFKILNFFMTVWQVCDTLLYAQLKGECLSFMSVFSLAVVTRYIPTVLAVEDQMLAVLH